MDPEVHSQFDRVWEILERTAKRGEEMEARFNRRMELAEKRMEKFDQRMDRAEQRMDRAEKRMDRAEQRMDRAEKRMDRAEQRMDRADRQIEATRRLVEAGMKFVMRNSADIKALTQRMDAYIRAMGNGRNGNGHRPRRSR